MTDESAQDADAVFTRPVEEGGYGFGPWVSSADIELRYSPYKSIFTVAGDVSYVPLKGSGVVRYSHETGDPMGEREYSAQLCIASFGVQFYMSQGTTRPYLGARLQWSFVSGMKMDFPGRESHT